MVYLARGYLQSDFWYHGALVSLYIIVVSQDICW